MHRPLLYLLILSQMLCFTITVFSQIEPVQSQGELLPQAEVLNNPIKQKRDPFIPLIDKEGALRKDFTKPVITEQLASHIHLMGISKVNNIFYAIVDGKWVKVGDMLGDFIIDKIESDKIILKFGEKEIEIKLYVEKE